MIREMTGWKVVDKYRYSFGSCGNHSLHYRRGLLIVPKLQNSKIFFFKNKSDAARFGGCGIILRCTAFNCTKIKYTSSEAFLDTDFWLARKNKKSIKNCVQVSLAPKGTWVADSIICFE